MIISASRRTDIPAFYSEWFYNRVKEGFVYVKNPMNPKQISKISLKPDVVDCFVFWTKNPKKMISDLKIIDRLGITYYFQFTINSYNQEIETNVPVKTGIIDTFIHLSEKIGKNRIIWRYDPILLSEKITIEYHLKYFEYLASKLNKYTNKCIISFIDFYKKCQRNLKQVNPIEFDEQIKRQLAESLQAIAVKYDLVIETCSEDIELKTIGIKHGKCIDDKLIEKLCQGRIKIEKDKNQREACGCVTSIDIGSYNTCAHGCLYCYANFNNDIVLKNIKNHNPTSPLLFGEIGPHDKISERNEKRLIDKQIYIGE
ncbi:MAG: DUF1848 domain-containing protein [Desulfobacteraceae bacterium]|jgi:hypothetical protein